MKQTFDLLAEVLSLPLSELFLEKDLLAEIIPNRKAAGPYRRDQVAELNKGLQMLGLRIAKHINRHASFQNVDQLQSVISYVFKAEDILQMAEPLSVESPSFSVDVVNNYYIMLLKRIAKSFMSSRGGKAVVKYWAGSKEAYQNVDQLPSGMSKAIWDRDILKSQNSPQRIEAWHSLLQRIPESLLLSCYSVCMVETEDLNYAKKRNACFGMLQRFGDTIHIADAMLDRQFEKGLAETHLHANASRSFDLIWEIALDMAVSGQTPLSRNHDLVYRTEIQKQIDCEETLEAAILRAVLASFLKSGESSLREYLQGHWNENNLCFTRQLIKALDLLSGGNVVVGAFSSAVSRPKPFLEALSDATSEYLPHILQLPSELYLVDVGLAERCFMAWSILYITQSTREKGYADTGFTASFLYYLRLKHKFYRNRIQDSKSKGLSYFQKFYRISTDTGYHAADTALLQIFYTALRDKRVIKTELRFVPPISKYQSFAFAEREITASLKEQLELFIRQHLYAIITLYGNDSQDSQRKLFEKRETYSKRWNQALFFIRQGRSGVLKNLLEQQYSVNLESVHPHRLGVLFHFIKMGEANEKASFFLNRQTGSQQDKYAAFSFGKARFQYQAAVHAIRQLRQNCPAVGNLVIGLDAASLELRTEPWVFAPAFRYAREPEVVLQYQSFGQSDGKQRLLGITYHVGEEFHHPLSGLRHISEAVSFFKMHSGDRLGHALALGIDIDYWFHNHRMTSMPCIEWMEDCLWAWETAVSMSEPNGLSSFTKFLETEILFCANSIYGTLNGISVKKLCDAYRSKTLDYANLREIERRWEQKNVGKSIDCLREDQNRSYYPCALQAFPDREFWWSEDALAMSYHSSYFKNRMSNEIMREVTLQEIDLTKQLQSLLRKMISENGIILEENPSSNAVIGEMDGVMSHPICNLRSKDSHDSIVIASINTDDPSVFNSNVANEHALIYFALLHHGYSVEESLQIMNEIREAGISSSFLSDAPPFDTLLEEYEVILRQIMM